MEKQARSGQGLVFVDRELSLPSFFRGGALRFLFALNVMGLPWPPPWTAARNSNVKRSHAEEFH